MDKRWVRNICIAGMILRMSVSILGNETQDNEQEMVLFTNQTIVRENEGQEEITSDIKEIQEEEVLEIAEEKVEEVIEQNIEEEVIWEEINFEDANAANVKPRSIVAEQIIVPLYEAIGHGEAGIDLSYLGYSIEQLKSEFITAIFKTGCIDSSICRDSVTSRKGSSMLVKMGKSEGIESLTLYNNGYCEIRYSNRNYMIERYNTMQSAISDIMNEVNQAKSEIEKELIIHDYLVLNGKYDHNNYLNNSIPHESYSAYGLLVNHTSVCNGYAYAMKYLLTKAGIECEIVSGLGNGGAHAWNIVKIDGNYYYIDTTWDDPTPDMEGRILHKYFNISQEDLLKDHAWNTWEYPEANSKKYDIFREHVKGICYNGGLYYVKNSHEYNESNGYTDIGSIIRYDLVEQKEDVVITVKSRIDEGNLWNIVYHNKSIYYIEATLNTSTFTYVSSIVRYDLVNQKRRILTTVNGNISEISLDRQQKIIEYKISRGGTSKISMYGEVSSKVKDFVKQVYTRVLNREAGNEEIEYWGLQIYTEATNPSQMIATLIETDEFKDKKLTNKQYLQLLYTTLFNRKMDEGGLYWLSELEKGSTRLYILSQLSQGEEFNKLCNEYDIDQGSISLVKNIDKNNHVTQFVHRFYSTCMGRCPDSEGLQFWVDALSEQRSSVKEVVYFFVHSDEMTGKKLSDEDYLEILYKSFFGREADEQGKAYWLSGLANYTYSKDDLLRQFVYSAEFNGICGQYNLRLE